MKHKEQRVLVLFDTQNLYYSVKHIYNTKVNFKEILNEAVAGRKLVRAISYVIKTDIKEEKNFHEALNKMGIEVKAKDLQIFIGGTKKGDWDIGIAMDAVRLQPKIDTLVLVSGDGDFKDLLAYMKSHGVRCEVIAVGTTASKHIREEADEFFDLEKNPKKFLINYRGKVKTYVPDRLRTGKVEQPYRKPGPRPKLGSKPVSKPKPGPKPGARPPIRRAPRKPPIPKGAKTPDEDQQAIIQANLNQVK